MEYYSIDGRKLRGWLYRNATPVKVKYDNEFSYLINDQVVTISKELPDHLDEYINFCKKKGLKYEVNPYILCLLHEVGHDQTLLFMNELDYIIDSIINKITNTYSKFDFIRKLKYKLYFSSPTEVAATMFDIIADQDDVDMLNELLLRKASGSRIKMTIVKTNNVAF